MPNPALNGNHASTPTQHDESFVNTPTSEDLIDERPLQLQNDDTDIKSDEPPLKRRKFTDDGGSHRSSRASSPPWKAFSAEGPTSFVENGRRKSGRTNAVPLEKQPHSSRRQTRAAYDKTADKNTRPTYSSTPKARTVEKLQRPSVKQETPKRGPGRPPKVKVEEQAQTGFRHMNGRSPRRKYSKPIHRQLPIACTNGHKDDSSGSERTTPSLTSSPPLTFSKVKFRVALPKPSIATPTNIPLAKRWGSFLEFLENDQQEPFMGQDLMSKEQIRKEAVARYRVHEAQGNGQLSKATVATGAATAAAASAAIDRNQEPHRQYAHFDHLLRHVTHFRNLLRQEQKDHRRKAEQIAYEAKRYLEEKRRKGRVKTADELAQETLAIARNSYRAVVKDLDKLWSAVEAEVNFVRLRQYEEEQQTKIKGHLNRVLERTDQMLQRQDESDIVTELEDVGSHDSESTRDVSDSEEISDSGSESGAEAGPDDPDANLTAEELKAKYENIPDVDHSDMDASNEDESSMETSDEDTEMDSEFDTDASDADRESEEEESEADNDAGGLMSLFFSKKQIAEMKVHEPEVEDAKFKLLDGETETMEEPSRGNKLIEELDDKMDTEDASKSTVGAIETYREDTVAEALGPTAEQANTVTFQASPTNIALPDATKSTGSPEPASHAKLAVKENPSIKTSIPPLLRGTLREYQHEGLDWLANLYANGRSGILADEMGLGKTIQSISLLAHLATEYEVWGPHLIVVPTSVMLNWEMEFKKFLPGFKILTYYGNLEERKQKRRGWMADDSFNVCITSYQLVLQDANSFKRRKWHYMILDEAHNIKNFRSERWQTMMTFNTRARLLLTGTPLQNNLTELWSLLFFLHYGQDGQDDDDAFAGLNEWSLWFKRPVESILEHGKQTLDAEDKEQVAKLHKVIRPYLLRRLKADVEKQMPAKYEHVEMCRLSKRQRQLYDGFMSRAQTKETLASGNYLSIINALMQLRKVCNHPDLFETRPINTSFAIQKSVAADFEIKDLLIRRKLFGSHPLEEIDLDFLQLVPISNEKISLIENLQTLRRHAYAPIKALRDSQWSRVNRQAVPSYHRTSDVLSTLDNVGRRARLQDLDRTVYYEAYRHHQRPIYGRGLLEKLKISTTYEQLSKVTGPGCLTKSWETASPHTSLRLVNSIENRSDSMISTIRHYACVTPAVVALDLGSAMASPSTAATIRSQLATRVDPFHQARIKLSIAFPDKRLLQYDCGKLQRLDKLLRRLQAGGHRALIFTQMTKVLDILEQFLNIHGHRYLRLDGATKIEQRQILTDRFNNDTRILAFILSSRSGGLGINLTGADTVIFYDLDWNPAMDKQCTDRAHRIGQTRDVHIYRFVSDHTIESNILRKANQKQMLDDVVIQEGDFTTDYKNRVTYKDMLDDNTESDTAGAAMDRVLGNDRTAVAAFEHAEDKEDVSAAKVAVKEVQHADDGDFEDKQAATPHTGEVGTPGPFGATNAALTEIADDAGIGHIDDYLLKTQTYLLKDVPFIRPREKSGRGRKRDDHKRRRPR